MRLWHDRPVGDLFELFYSYSHKDKALRANLDTHLIMLERQGVISGWHDRDIEAGDEWAGEISEHLERASLILLLISADFLASPYCYDVEVRRAMERHEAKQARVVPVILRPVDGWHEAPFGKLEALPRQGKAVTTWDNRDEAFADIAGGLRRAVSRQRSTGPYPGTNVPGGVSRTSRSENKLQPVNDDTPAQTGEGAVIAFPARGSTSLDALRIAIAGLIDSVDAVHPMPASAPDITDALELERALDTVDGALRIISMQTPDSSPAIGQIISGRRARIRSLTAECRAQLEGAAPSRDELVLDAPSAWGRLCDEVQALLRLMEDMVARSQ
jgi:hypothetical protein